MKKIWLAALIVVSFLFAAPIIESSTSATTQMFVAVGNADGGGY